MNTFKTLLALGALAASAYAVFLTINGPHAQLPPDFATQATVEGPPLVEFAPPFAAAPGGDANGPAAPWGNVPTGNVPMGNAALSTALPSDHLPPGNMPAARNGTDALPPINNPFAGNTPSGTRYPVAEASPFPAAEGFPPAEASVSDLPMANSPAPAEVVPQLSVAEYNKALTQAQEFLEKGRLAEALQLLSQYYEWRPGTGLPAKEQEQLQGLLDQLAGTVVYSRQNWLEPAYVVQAGDTLDQIAEAYQVPTGLLAKINGIPAPYEVRPGDQLKVVPGPFEAVVDTQNLRLTLRLGDLYAGRFNIGVGQDWNQQAGEFRVQRKPGMGADAAPPGGPFGTTWIDLGDRLAVHAAVGFSGLGNHEGAGCVLVSTRDLTDLQDILSVGSRVTIHGAPAAGSPAMGAARPVADRYGNPTSGGYRQR